MPLNDKKALEQLIRKADVLEFSSIHIDRKLSTSSKKSRVSEFARAADKSLAYERDVLLIKIKLR